LLSTLINRRKKNLMKHHAIALAVALAAAALHPHFVKAADTPPPAAGTVRAVPVDRLATARELVAGQQWSAALAELNRVGDTGSADWNNLVDVALRKGNWPDRAASGRSYDAALRVDVSAVW
jgi:hypothetical protein